MNGDSDAKARILCIEDEVERLYGQDQDSMH
jgi:hypothetical protein